MLHVIVHGLLFISLCFLQIHCTIFQCGSDSRLNLIKSLLCHTPSGRSSHAHFPKPRREMMSAVSLVVLSCLLTGVQSRSNGAPPQACANISPDPSVSGHNASAQTSAVPYALTGLPSSGNYTPGMSYTRECPNPRTSAYLTPNCRSQTCLYQCANTLDEYPALVRRTHAFYQFLSADQGLHDRKRPDVD